MLFRSVTINSDDPAYFGGYINQNFLATFAGLPLDGNDAYTLARNSIEASFVGHPLADTIPLEVPRAAARAQLGYTDEQALVAVLPGSRRGEVAHIAPTFLQTVALLARQRPELRFVLPVAPGLMPTVQAMVREHAPDAPLQVTDGQSHAALAACDVTLIASGTATLEAALFKRPMVIAYKISALSWPIMKRMAYLPWVGLPNILARDFLVPERLQHDASPLQLAADVLSWLDQPQRMDAVRQRFVDMHLALRQDTAHAATQAIAVGDGANDLAMMAESGVSIAFHAKPAVRAQEIGRAHV